MEEAGEFQDWEMLQNTETTHDSASNPDERLSVLDGIDSGSEGMIRSDYFALDSKVQFGKKAIQEDQVELLRSDDSKLDGKRDLGFEGIEIGGGNTGVLEKFGEFEGKGEMGYGIDVKREVGFGGIEGIEKVEVGRENFIEVWLESIGDDGRVFDGNREVGCGDDAKGVMGFEGIGIESKNSGEFVLDSGGDEGDELVSGNFEGVMGEDELGHGGIAKTSDGSESGEVVEVEGGNVEEGVEFSSGVENGDGVEAKSNEGEKRVVWYKLPLELLKFCVYRVSPVWSLSIAAAVVGFVILRRRLYMMRRKSRTIPLKVSMDDKKVSQIMVRVARLNEAFSVVKRVPIIRSSLSGTGGLTPWPVMGLR